jgi:nitroimidazol reductase NimA-like FMN-containing flavoprotein (pyridoxamine 5'-phosphate oxidase superfamily)
MQAGIESNAAIIYAKQRKKKGFYMRDMTEREILDFIRYYTWGTLIGVEGNKPYAVELSYGYDGDYIYCGSMPGGRMAHCIRGNANVAFKICECDWDYARFRAVIVEGPAERMTSREDIMYAVEQIARQRKLPKHAFAGIADRLVGNPESNSLRIPVTTIGGKIAGY